MFQLKWLWKNMGKQRGLWVVGLILSAVTSAMQIINPKLSQILIDEVITPQNTEKLMPVLGLMLAVQLVRLTLRYGMIACMENSSQTMLQGMRKHIFTVMQNQDMHFFGSIRTGDLMTRMTNDLDMVRHAVAWISYNIVDSVVIFVVAFVYLLTVNVQFTLALAAITPFILIITRAFSKIIHPRFVILRQKLSKLNTVVQENIAGNRVVKAFAREEFEKEKFEEKNNDYREYNFNTSMVWLKFFPFIEFLSQSLTVTSVLVGGIFMINGKLTAGEMLAFSSLTWALSNPLRNLGTLLNDMQRFFASCNMIIELYYSKSSITDGKKPVELDHRLSGKIEFDHVTLAIHGTKVLNDVSFTLQPGQTLGMMGTTGSGKTTLVDALARFYDPSSGRVLVDGIDVRRIKLSDLRSSIGMAMQDVFLFSDTVDSNIAYGDPDMPFENVQQCAVASDADSFIQKLETGYETIIGERGVGLSGGQRQRIALARALAIKPPILVLDDTTSAVDMETEQYIQNQLRSLDFTCTKIIIAQRVSSVKDADSIIILDQGRIVEQGTHKELIAKKGYYYSIWALQNSIEDMTEGSENYGAQ